MHFHDGQTGWVAGDSGTLLKTTNGGTTWTPKPSTTTQSLRKLHFTDAATGWAVGDSGVLLRSTDGGETWQARASGVTTGLRAVGFVGTDTAWVAGDAGVLLRTVNGGASWQRVGQGSLPDTLRIQGLAFRNGSVGYIAGGSGYQGSLLRTTNGGLTWSNVPGVPDGEWTDVDLAGSVIVGVYRYWIAFGPSGLSGPGYGSVRSLDGGTTFANLTGHALNLPRALHVVDSSEVWSVADRGQIHRWDAVNGWVVQSTDHPALNSIHISGANGWAVGAGGTILKRPSSGTSVRGGKLLSEARVLRAGYFTYTLAASGHIRINLRNLDGRLAARLVDGEMPAGTHALPLAGLVPSGLYVVDLHGGGEHRRLRIVLP